MALKDKVIEYFEQNGDDIQKFALEFYKEYYLTRETRVITLKSGIVVELSIGADIYDVWMNGSTSTFGSQKTELICLIDGLTGH
jgi:hypothetical protein